MKLIAILLLVSALLSAVYWVVGLAQEREQALADLDKALVSNESKDAALSRMAALYAQSQEQVADRDRRNADIERRLRQTNRELIDAKKSPQITIAERECMDSTIPIAVLNILREAPSIDGGSGTDQGMPRSRTVRRGTLAAVLGQYMDRPRQLHQDAASRVFKVEWRSNGDQGVL